MRFFWGSQASNTLYAQIARQPVTHFLAILPRGAVYREIRPRDHESADSQITLPHNALSHSWFAYSLLPLSCPRVRPLASQPTLVSWSLSYADVTPMVLTLTQAAI